MIRDIRAGLSKHRDAERAEGMRAYMKSEMPFYGVQSPAQKLIFDAVFDKYPLETFDGWQESVLAIWHGAKHREERYAAIALTGRMEYREFQTPEALPMYEEMIVTGAWWDYVDTLAIQRIGEFLLAGYPRVLKPILLRWTRSSDLWKRRSSIIAQVKFKDRTDLRLLYKCIDANLGDRDFFIRKGIGWALRAYAWVDPDEVVRFVRAHESEMSPLSKKEALRNVGKIRGEAKRG